MVALGKKGELHGLSVRVGYWKRLMQGVVVYECECKERERR